MAIPSVDRVATPAKKTPEESKTPKVVEVKPPEPKKADVRSIKPKITLVNPFTKTRAQAGRVTDNILVDSWWSTQVSAGVAEWK